MTMTITSPAFSDHGEMPPRHTCDAEDISPPLEFSAIPDGTASLVLIVDDPDAPDPAAPRMTWTHWLLYNLSADTSGLAEAIRELPVGTLEGINDWKITGYGGPCPPIGRHRYFFKLYALDCTLPDLNRPTKGALLQAMEAHILARAELVGTYRRSR